MRFFLLTQSPYTVHLSAGIDVAEILRSGFEFIVLDATDLLLPELRGIHGDIDETREVWRIASSQQLTEVAQGFRSSDVVVLFGCYFDNQLDDPRNPYAIVAESSALLGALSSGHLPVHLPIGRRKPRGRTSLYRDVLRPAARHPMTFARTVRQRLARLLGQSQFRSGGRVHRTGLRPLNLLWTGTMIRPVSPRLIGPETFVRYIHTLDAEYMRDFDVKPLDECDYLLYLDSLGPSHPDYAVQENPYSVSMDDYTKHIHTCLTSIARTSGLDIVIAAHPRASQGSLDGVYGDFPVKYQQTAELICSARAVIDASGSTAVGIAAIARRPLVFLTSESFGKGISRTQQSLIDWINPLVIDTDKQIVEWTPPEVDELAYDTYVHTFVKRQGSTSHRFWEHVVADILASMVASDPSLGRPSPANG